MGGAPNTSANLSCLGLKWHANFWESRSGQLPVGRQCDQDGPPTSLFANSPAGNTKSSARFEVCGLPAHAFCHIVLFLQTWKYAQCCYKNENEPLTSGFMPW
jgi:hypothetical protein